MRFRHVTFSITALSMLLATGCVLNSGKEQQPPASITYMAPSPDGGLPISNATNVSGFVWDPEAYGYALLSCVPHPLADGGETPGCPSAPVLVPDTPTFEASVVHGAEVALFDPVAQMPTFFTRGPTGQEGDWQIPDVTTRAEPPFLPVALPTDAGTGLHPSPFGPPPGVPGSIQTGPTPNYLPTVTLQPIFTGYTRCQDEGAALIGDNGILQTVAQYLTMTGGGGAVTVADLLNPGEFGGIAIVWAFQPSTGAAWVPAFSDRASNEGVVISATQAGTPLQVLNIAWADPNNPDPRDPPPPPWTSARGYFVLPSQPLPDGGTPGAPLGLAVVLVPPLRGPPTPVKIGFQDNFSAPGDPNANPPQPERPFEFADIPAQIIPPGQVSFMALPAILPGSPPDPAWLCLEPFLPVGGPPPGP